MSAYLKNYRARMRTENQRKSAQACKGNVYQLDTFNRDSQAYDCVRVSADREKLGEYASELGLTAWRIWNRTTRAQRDRMLPPVSAISKTFNHGRRFARVHKSPAKRSTEYENHQV